MTLPKREGESKQPLHNFDFASQNLSGGIKKAIKNLTQGSRHPGRDVNLAPPSHEAGPRRSVCRCFLTLHVPFRSEACGDHCTYHLNVASLGTYSTFWSWWESEPGQEGWGTSM